VQLNITANVVHTNLGTGYTLTDTDHFNVTFQSDGTEKDVGVFLHLRNASGQLVVVRAGQVRYDSNGDVVKFTPNSGPDAAAVICPALGGNPA
jgi:hypothetical protein